MSQAISADDRSVIGFSNIGLSKCPTQVAEVLKDDVGGDFILSVPRGHDTQLSQKARPHSIVPTP
jgi:hypothetical protein